jgi:hypothetical protein
VAGILADVPDIARRQALVAWAADEWAGPDVGRALRLEEALLQELHRRARETAPTKRDAWEAVLAEKGYPRGRARQQGRRLARLEWLEQERRREQFLLDVAVAQYGGNSPHSEHSPVSADFIAETLARSSHPVVRSAYLRERRMLAAMLSSPPIAGQVLERCSPEELLLPVHREIVRIVAEVLGAGGATSFAAVAERVSQDEELFAAAADAAVEDEGYDPADVERDVLLIREAHLLGDRGLRLYGGEAEPLAPAEAGENLAELERQVQELIASGEVSADDPRYLRLMEIRKGLHGKGEREYWDFQ